MDKQTIKEVLSQNTTRKDSTNDAYSQRLSTLTKRYSQHKEEEYTDWEFLKNMDDVIHFITKFPGQRKNKEGIYPLPSLTTQVGNLNPIIEFLKQKQEHILAEEYNKVKKVIDDKIDNKYYQSKGITDTQKENIISYEDLLKYCDKVDEEINILENKPLQSHLDLWTLEDLSSLKILLRLYLLHPSRNEYADLKFIKLQEYKKLKQPELNYVVIGTKKSYLSITDYKTGEKYGCKFIELQDKKLIKMLKDLKNKRDIEERDSLFYLQKTGTPWTNHNLCAVMTKYSRKLLDGKSICSTLLYKIVIKEVGQEYYEAIKNDDMEVAVKCNEILNTFAKTRGHSQAIQKKAYVIKE
jgi:hypothetical protein